MSSILPKLCIYFFRGTHVIVATAIICGTGASVSWVGIWFVNHNARTFFHAATEAPFLFPLGALFGVILSPIGVFFLRQKSFGGVLIGLICCVVVPMAGLPTFLVTLNKLLPLPGSDLGILCLSASLLYSFSSYFLGKVLNDMPVNGPICCFHCNYDLRGSLASKCCPECGTPIANVEKANIAEARDTRMN